MLHTVMAVPVKFSNFQKMTSDRGWKVRTARQKDILFIANQLISLTFSGTGICQVSNYLDKRTRWRSKVADSTIAELFNIKARFLRSVHLERDFQDPTVLS